jgi:hypothetical protein
MMSIKKILLLQICVMMLIISCQPKIHSVDLKKTNYDIFFGIAMESRKTENGAYVAYKFTKDLGDEKFSLPNYKYYNNDQIANDKLFDIAKYGKAKGMNSFSESNSMVMKYSDSVFFEFEKTKAYKIFSSHKQGHFIVFFLNHTDFIAYVPDKSKVYTDFWKEKLTNSKKIEPYWYSGKY